MAGASNSYIGFNLSSFLIFFILINFPILIYWLGFWIWGDGYLLRILLLPVRLYFYFNLKKYIPQRWYGKLPFHRSYWISLLYAAPIFLGLYLFAVNKMAQVDTQAQQVTSVNQQGNSYDFTLDDLLAVDGNEPQEVETSKYDFTLDDLLAIK